MLSDVSAGAVKTVKLSSVSSIGLARRTGTAVAALVALYACSILALRLSHMGQGWPFVDLSVYRKGGEAALAGRDLYDLRFPGALAFTYPPASALLFTALVPLSMDVLEPLVTAASVLLLPLALALALRLRPVRSWLTRRQATCLAVAAAAVALWLEPVWTALRYGQIDLLIAVLVLYDLSRDPASRWQGAAIGLAAGLKLTPGIFAVYLLLTRRTRAALVSLAVFAITVAVGFVLVPNDAKAFWGGAFLDSSRVGRAENAANQSLHGAFVRVLHSLSVSPAWMLSALAVGVLGMALAAQAGRSGDDARGFSLCALTALLISPVSWSHHWALAVPALLLLGISAWRAASTLGLLACAAVSAIGLSQVIWWVPVNHPAHSELHLDTLQLIYADAYVLIALLFLALAARSPTRRAVAPVRWR
jgi:alpha-1,2-mannosyltransferase